MRSRTLAMFISNPERINNKFLLLYLRSGSQSGDLRLLVSAATCSADEAQQGRNTTQEFHHEEIIKS